MNQNDDKQTIEPVDYRPSAETAQDSSAINYKMIAGAAGVLVLAVFWFLFSAKTVTLNFSSKPEQVALSGGINFKVGESFLLLKGEYLVDASSQGYFDINQDIIVGDDNSQFFDLSFEPLDGFLRVLTVPADAVTAINGESYGTDSVIQLSAGEHTLRVSHPDYIDLDLPILINGRSEEQSLSVVMEADWADTTISSTPAGARVFLDGSDLDVKTPAIVKVPSGEREILIRLKGYKDHRERLLSVAGKDRTLAPIELIKADVLLEMTSRPTNASVIVNGSYSGQTPTNLALRSDQKQEIKILKTGYAQYLRTLSLNSGQTERVHAELSKNLGEVLIEVEPKEANTLIDGQPIGQGSHNLELPTTQAHQIKVELDGYAGFSKAITPKLGITQSVKVRLLTNQEARLAAIKPVASTHLGQNLLLLQPFDFQMGASRREPGRRANETLRTVNMSRLFYLGTKEVTNREFREFAMGHDSGIYKEETLNEDDMPVAQISWEEAALFCNWLSERNDLEPFYQIELGKIIGSDHNSRGFRLPTEAEWAWAARAQESPDRTSKKFPWGQQLPPPDRTGNYADRSAAHLVGRIIFGYNDNYTVAAPVGTYKADSRGLFDLGGNVAEWTNDYYEIPAKEESLNPKGPKKGDFRVIRGSSWMHGTVTDLRYSFRDYGAQGRPDVGFRIARYAEQHQK